MMMASAIALLSKMKLSGGPHTRFAPPLLSVNTPPLTPKKPMETTMINMSHITCSRL